MPGQPRSERGDPDALHLQHKQLNPRLATVVGGRNNRSPRGYRIKPCRAAWFGAPRRESLDDVSRNGNTQNTR